MKFGIKDAQDLYIFDTRGNLVTKLDTLNESRLDLRRLHTGNSMFLFIKNEIFNSDLLKFIGQHQYENKSDYEKELFGEKRYIEIGSKKNIECGLIASGYVRDTNAEDHEYKIEIPKARLVTDIHILFSNGEVADFNLVFELLPYDAKDNVFKIHY